MYLKGAINDARKRRQVGVARLHGQLGAITATNQGTTNVKLLSRHSQLKGSSHAVNSAVNSCCVTVETDSAARAYLPDHNFDIHPHSHPEIIAHQKMYRSSDQIHLQEYKANKLPSVTGAAVYTPETNVKTGNAIIREQEQCDYTGLRSDENHTYKKYKSSYINYKNENRINREHGYIPYLNQRNLRHDIQSHAGDDVQVQQSIVGHEAEDIIYALVNGKNQSVLNKFSPIQQSIINTTVQLMSENRFDYNDTVVIVQLATMKDETKVQMTPNIASAMNKLNQIEPSIVALIKSQLAL